MSSSTPSLPTAFDPTTCTQKGLCPVTQILPQGAASPLESHSLYYELHGAPALTATFKVVFIMGLNSSSFAWGPQVKHFARQEGCAVLVFDNRGVGNSGYPRGPYTTSGMAEDVICLLDYVGWTNKRDLHVVGISLGGMIAQELAYRIPERITSLVLAVTTPGGHMWQNFPPRSGLVSLVRLLFTPKVEDKALIVMPMLFPAKWLPEKDEDDPKGRTNWDVQIEAYLRRILVTLPQRLPGHISQLLSALTHHVTPQRLAHISASIPKVTLVTGDDDNLVDPRHSLDLKAAMPEAELVQWKETGHGIHVQRPREFNELLLRAWKEGSSRVEGGWEVQQ